MRAGVGLIAGICAALVTAGCGPPRPDLPPPVAPLTRTPDAAFRKRPPPPDPDVSTSAYRMPTIGRHTLDNGLAVFWVERKDSPLVATTFVGRTAGQQTAPRKPGLAELTARMLLRGTRFPNGSLLRAVNVDRREPAVAVHLGQVEFSLETLPDATSNATYLLGHMVQHPAFLADQLEGARRAQLESLRDDSNRALSLMWSLGARLLFGKDHLLAWDAKRIAQVLPHYSIHHVRDFHRASYHPMTSALVAVGHVTGDQIPDLGVCRLLLSGYFLRGRGSRRTRGAIPSWCSRACPGRADLRRRWPGSQRRPP